MTEAFNFKEPDYIPVYHQRLAMLRKLREEPEMVPLVVAHYKTHPWLLINDWGVTYDPRNADVGLPTKMPFVLMPRQVEWCQWVFELWQSRRSGVAEKSRDCGVSWLAVALGSAICLTWPNVNIGYGSRKEEYVDKRGAPKALFWKAREFIKMLPPELRPGWSEREHSVHMLIRFPNGSTMTGEAGDSIGRGDRAAIYFVDEAAHLERPQFIDQGLSATTNCRIDISSANGTDNPFYEKVTRYPPERKFTFHWRDDPRKDQLWYDALTETLDPVTIAQEIDINYAAAKTGIVIPAEWVAAAVDADKVLGLTARGGRRGALDVADEGVDLNAFAWLEGVALSGLDEWSGKGSDIFKTVQHAFEICDQERIEEFTFDADGLGAGVRGDANVINTERTKAKVRRITVNPFRGSGEVFKPDSPIPTADASSGGRNRLDRTNGDYFLNAKAQGWWALRVRFQRVYRAVQAHKAGDPIPYSMDDMIVLRGNLPHLTKLMRELSQPTYDKTTAGKIIIDKLPDGARSPNLADAVMQLYAPRRVSFLTAL